MKLRRVEHDERSDAAVRNFPAVANEEHKFVAAAKNGDSDAFGILCMQSASMVLKIARRIMPTNEDADDVVQESFQLAFTHIRNFKGDSRFSTWLTRIVTNAALMRLRKNSARRELRLDEWLESDRHPSRFDIADQRFNPEQLYTQKECHMALRTAVNELKPGVRSAIELREFEERSIEESARILGISTGAVKSRLFHGRRRLRRLLNRMKYAPMHRNESLPLSRKPNGTSGRQLAYDAGD